MDFEKALIEVRRLGQAAQALAALGADIQLRTNEKSNDVRVRALLQEVVRAINPALLNDLTEEQRVLLLGTVRIVFLDATDLLNNPTRTPGWNHTDPSILDAQSWASRRIVKQIAAAARERPELAMLTERPGTFLDVGTGVGRIAIEAARLWPSLKIVGLDVWEPALALARTNIAASGVGERIELRQQGIESLNENEHYSLVWLPAPFIPRSVLEDALDRLSKMLEPQGWVIVGQFSAPNEPLARALTSLRLVRSGGDPWSAAEIAEAMRARGYIKVESLPAFQGFEFALGRRAT
jgi:ubiquinone/menaquinone biosynthesis C-methylase UbiE